MWMRQKMLTFTARNGMKSVGFLTLITSVEGPGDFKRWKQQLITCGWIRVDVNLSRNGSRWSEGMCLLFWGDKGNWVLRKFCVFKIHGFFYLTEFAGVLKIFTLQDIFALLCILVHYFPLLWEMCVLQQAKTGFPRHRLLLEVQNAE